jgi:predicted dehydrogenase
MIDLTRREAMKLAVGAGFALAMNRATAARGQAIAAENSKKVRIGFIGVGDRGTGLLKVTLNAPGVEVPAVCDIDPAASKRAQTLVEKGLGKRPETYEKGPHDYRRLLERDDIDAVIIATPQELHAEMAIDSFKAKKFVGSEVPACTTIDECHAMIKARRETGGGYMMLENYLYSQPVMMVQNMVDQGVFGDLTYGFGAYIHEIRNMRFNKDGSLTWRGHNVLKNRGIVYPTHAIGPVCRWMGVDGVKDSLQTVVAMDSKSAATKIFAAEKFGPDSEAAKINFENGDTNQALIRTKQGRLIEVRYDTSSPRPPGMGQYSLQGTKGSYDSAFGLRKIFIEGRTPAHQWEDLEKYESEYQHPYWAKEGEQAKTAGHGGGDWFVISDFLKAVRTGISPIDIHDAVTWTSIRPLSEQSIRSGSQPVAVPDFRKT